MLGPLHAALYAFEHQLLPRLFYELGLAFIMDIQQENRLNEIAQEFISDAHPGVEVPKNLLRGGLCHLDEEKNEFLQVIEFTGGPEQCPLVHTAFLYFTRDFEHKLYMTFEYEFDGGDPVFCAWGEDKKHYNYEKTARDFETMIDMAAAKGQEWKKYS